MEAGADDDPLRFGVHPTHPGHVIGHGGAQLEHAAGIAVAEGVVRRSGQRSARRGEPLRAGEVCEVGRSRHQAVRGAVLRQPRTGRGLRRPPRFGPHGHPRAGTLLGGEPALGDQLGIGVGDGVAGDAEIGRQRPG